jgi:meso-butanediol dehydrogenase/(S,S)-butanediol dehydrogenase/diacetyl reductase
MTAPSTPRASEANPRPSPVLLTGAGSGIGQATCRLFASRGHPVAAADVRLDAAEVTRAAVERAGGDAIAIHADVTSGKSMDDAVTATLVRFGDLGVIVACAGVAAVGTATELTIDQWDRLLAVNLTGVLHTARAALPTLIDRGGGAIVVVASDAAVRGATGFTAYCASKHGVLGLVRCLALDYSAFGVRTNAVCPSFTATPMAAQILDDLSLDRTSYEQSRQLGRFATPTEVAYAIAHLASPEASYTNGLAYALDAGLTAG